MSGDNHSLCRRARLPQLSQAAELVYTIKTMPVNGDGRGGHGGSTYREEGHVLNAIPHVPAVFHLKCFEPLRPPEKKNRKNIEEFGGIWTLWEGQQSSGSASRAKRPVRHGSASGESSLHSGGGFKARQGRQKSFGCGARLEKL